MSSAACNIQKHEQKIHGFVDHDDAVAISGDPCLLGQWREENGYTTVAGQCRFCSSIFARHNFRRHVQACRSSCNSMASANETICIEWSRNGVARSSSYIFRQQRNDNTDGRLQSQRMHWSPQLERQTATWKSTYARVARSPWQDNCFTRCRNEEKCKMKVLLIIFLLLTELYLTDK